MAGRPRSNSMPPAVSFKNRHGRIVNARLPVPRRPKCSPPIPTERLKAAPNFESVSENALQRVRARMDLDRSMLINACPPCSCMESHGTPSRAEFHAPIHVSTPPARSNEPVRVPTALIPGADGPRRLCLLSVVVDTATSLGNSGALGWAGGLASITPGVGGVGRPRGRGPGATQGSSPVDCSPIEVDHRRGRLRLLEQRRRRLVLGVGVGGLEHRLPLA